MQDWMYRLLSFGEYQEEVSASSLVSTQRTSFQRIHGPSDPTGTQALQVLCEIDDFSVRPYVIFQSVVRAWARPFPFRFFLFPFFPLIHTNFDSEGLPFLRARTGTNSYPYGVQQLGHKPSLSFFFSHLSFFLLYIGVCNSLMRGRPELFYLRENRGHKFMCRGLVGDVACIIGNKLILSMYCCLLS
jgi:hypothetical protein